MNDKGYKKKIERRLEGFAPGKVFVVNDFADIAENDTIRQILKARADGGKIDRVMRGVYHKAKFNKNLGEKIPPSIDVIAHAIARARKWTIASTGEAALNALGLSTQVPMTWIYISNGPYINFDMDGSEIRYKRSTSRDITQLSPTTLLVVQALKALGKAAVDDEIIGKISKRLSDKERSALLKESARTTVWIRSVICKIYNAGEAASEEHCEDVCGRSW